MTNPRVSVITEGIIDYLNSQNALSLLPEIIANLQNSRAAKSDVVVESAVPLTDGEIQQIQDLLVKNYSISGPVKFSVNPSLIGGLKISIGDLVLDTSVQARLEDLYAG